MKGKIKNMVDFINGLDDNQLEFLLEESGTQTTLDKELIYLTCEMVKSNRTNDTKCVICHGDLLEGFNSPISSYGYGHNAEPIASGQCCSTCNQIKVIPARLEQFKSWAKNSNSTNQ